MPKKPKLPRPTRQLAIHIIAHKKRAIVTITIEKTTAKIASPITVRFIATASRSGSRWWLLFPVGSNVDMSATCPTFRAHNLLGEGWHFGFSGILRYIDQASCRQAGLRQEAISLCTPKSRMLRSVMGGPAGCFMRSRLL
jgi:hypothetical protein